MDASQEMVALGVSNILGSFVKAMPTTHSLSRHAHIVVIINIILIITAIFSNLLQHQPHVDYHFSAGLL